MWRSSWIWLILLALSGIHHATHAYCCRIWAWGPDMHRQIVAAQNLNAGRGYSTTEVIPTDLAQTADVPLVFWPPGYSFLLAPVLAITNDISWSVILLDWVAIAIFVVAWGAILHIL